MLGSAYLVAFAATARPEESLLFYRDVLGLTLVEDTEFATVYSANGTMLRVQKVTTVADIRYTVIGWNVIDIESCVARLFRQGIELERYENLSQDKHGIWTVPDGAKVAWFKDVDGNTLSLTQPIT